MVNCRSEGWKTFDVKLLWTFDSVSFADTVRSWWSVSIPWDVFNFSFFLNLHRFPFEKLFFWNGWNPPSAASSSHPNSHLWTQDIKKEMWPLWAESFFHRPQWSRTTNGASVLLLWLCFSSILVFWGFFLLIFLYMFEIWFYGSSLAPEGDTFVISELSH